MEGNISIRLSMEDWVRAYKEKGALWIHDGNPKRPHALLTSGKHSNGFFNSRLVCADDELLQDAARDLLALYSEEGEHLRHIWVVVGPQTGATKLAQALAQEVASITGFECRFASPAKHEEDGKRSMVFSDMDAEAVFGASLIVCEDVITTGGSVERTVAALEDRDATILPYILTLVNRSGLSEVRGRKIIALIDHEMPIWDPKDCPLCKLGSKAIRPKDNWAELNAEY